MKKRILLPLWLGVAAVLLLIATPSQAQNPDAPARLNVQRWLEPDKIWKVREQYRWRPLDTIQTVDYQKATAGKIRAFRDEQNLYQHFIVMRRLSPWRLGTYVGPAFVYCGSWENVDRTLFLNKNGHSVHLFLDRYFGKKNILGFGALVGLQTFYPSPGRYQLRIQEYAASAGIPNESLAFIRPKPSQDLYFLLGPVLSLPLGRKISIEAQARAGLFRTEAGIVGAYATNVQGNRLIEMVGPTGERFFPGYMGTIGLQYHPNDKWGVGITGGGFNTKQDLFTSFNQGVNIYRRIHGGFYGGLLLTRRFDQKKIIPVECPAPPNCAEPQLESPMNGKAFASPASMQDIVFKWKSGLSQPDTSETYTFKLYRRNSNSPIYTAITKETELPWPDNVALPLEQDSLTYYYYTVHSNRQTKTGKCMSEYVASSFAYMPPMPAPQNVAGDAYNNGINNPTTAGVSDCTDQYVHRIYDGKVTPMVKILSEKKDSLCLCNGKQIFKYKYRRKMVPISQAFISEVESLQRSDTRSDMQVSIPQELLPSSGQYKSLKYKHMTFMYEIQKVPCAGRPEVGSSWYKVYVNAKGKIFNIVPMNR